MENIFLGYANGLKDATKKAKACAMVLLFLVIFSLSLTEVYYSYLTPFGISLVFALFYVGINGYMLAMEFAIAYTLASLSTMGLVVSASTSLMLILGEYLRGKLKKKKIPFKIWHAIILYALSLVALSVMGVGGMKENIALFVSIILSGIFLFISLHFIKGVLRKGIWVGLNLDEKICGSVLYLVTLLGASKMQVGYFNFGLVLFSLSILLSVFIFKGGSQVIISFVSGLSLSLNYLNPMYISLAVTLTIVCLTFKCNKKILSAIAFVLAYMIFVVLFDVGLEASEIFSICTGAILFMFVPNKLIERLSGVFVMGGAEIQTDMLNKIKKQIEGRLNNLSQVFDDMNVTYRSMVRGTLSDDKSMGLLKTELKRGVCEHCPDKNNCYRLGNSFLENSFDMMVSNGYERGKVLLVDLPQYLTSNCSRVNTLLGYYNNMLKDYKDYTSSINNLDTSRVLIAEQLYATSKLLSVLSKDLSAVVTIDKTLEEKIVEELRYGDIMCIEATVYQKDISVKEIVLIVTNDTINVKKIEKIVGEVTRVDMSIIGNNPSSIPEASVITMVSSPNYDIAFGVSSTTKFGSKSSGDNHAIIKLDEGKFLVSLSDGMGSGDRAKKISLLTVHLVENFYKAGFDSDVILTTVNKLLSLNEEENFATIDLCIIDGRNNTYDFIKFAGCDGYIIHDKGKCEVIEGSNLPVGILDDIKPHVSKRLITNMDMLVLMSDGVEDALSPHVNISDYLRSLDIINPQSLSDEILSRALDFSDGVAKDDMTVICVRVFGHK